MTLSEASFLIPSRLIKFFLFCFFSSIGFILLVGQDSFSCIAIGRNTVALYKENDRPLEIESSLIDVMKKTKRFF